MGARVICLVLAFLLIGCGREFEEYDLDTTSFDHRTIDLIESVTGIDIPNGARGIRFRYIPPIDPIYFAKIQIPAKARKDLESQLQNFGNDQNFPEDYANERYEWWPTRFGKSLIERKAGFGSYFVEVYLIEENDHLILYLKYFVV